jgi:hypothetical protein
VPLANLLPVREWARALRDREVIHVRVLCQDCARFYRDCLA